MHKVAPGEFLSMVNLTPHDSILWTEMCKCQSINGEPPLQSFRTCISNYLSTELYLLKEKTPLVCVGNMVYRAMAFRFPNKVIVGIPHPTGSYGHWSKLVKKEEYIKKTKSKIFTAIKFNLAVRVYPSDF